MNLDQNFFVTKWDEFRRKALDWQDQRRIDRLNKVNSVRERSISILQHRYGYTREQAICQLKKYSSRALLG